VAGMGMRIAVDRAVEVLHDRGPESRPQWAVGSGFLVGGNRVLTAARNVGAGALLIRIRGDREYRATIVGSGSGEAADLALLEIADPLFDHQLDRVRFARVDRSRVELVSGCWAVGFPRFKEHPGVSKPPRLSTQVSGEIPTAENVRSGLLTLRVTAAPRPFPAGELSESAWEGISGAVVFAADDRLGDCAVGVIVEHDRPEWVSSLTVVPITALETIDQKEERDRWWELLGVPDPSNLPVLPSWPGPPAPDYWATVEEIAQRAPVVLDREDELAELAAFATGTEGYLWLVGSPWAGKSTLAAHFARACPPEVDCVAYFLVRRLADADSSRFTAAVTTQLAWLLGLSLPALLDDPVLLRSLWAQAVKRAEQTGRHLLLVVDGLDEDLSRESGRPSVAALLPSQASGRAHVLVTSRPHPGLPDDVHPDHPLRRVQPFVLAPSSYAEALAQRAMQELNQGYPLLGAGAPAQGGTQEFQQRSAQLRAFLCHSSSDKGAVRQLYSRLRADGVRPWLDEEDILPGQDWDREIRKAIRASDVVLVCLSRSAISKVGYIQKEIKDVLDVAEEQPEGTIFLIPVRLEPCEVPDRIKRWQWVDLFQEKASYERLIRALRLVIPREG
jgi:hypothetical protein